MYGIIYKYTCIYVYCRSFRTSSFLSTHQILFKIICDRASEKGQDSTKFTETKCYDDFNFIFKLYTNLVNYYETLDLQIVVVYVYVEQEFKVCHCHCN